MYFTGSYIRYKLYNLFRQVYRSLLYWEFGCHPNPPTAASHGIYNTMYITHIGLLTHDLGFYNLFSL